MDYETLKYESKDRIATITLDRPERRNALDIQVCKEIAAAMLQAEAEDDVLCVVLTGAGDVFSAGQNLKFTLGANAATYDVYRRNNRRMRDTIQKLDKPVIARVQGDAIGGGTYIATCCDLVVAVEDARFAMREIQAGVQSGGAHLFTVGRARSMELNLLGQHIDAKTAERWNLINRAVPSEELDDVVDYWTDIIVGLPPLGVTYTKKSMNLLLDMAGYYAWLDAHLGLHPNLPYTADGRESKRAFVEKRTPVYTGEISAPGDN